MSIINKVYFIDDTENKKLGLFCSFCDFILVTAQDIESQRENDCCENCWMNFGESRKKDWQSGWRPDQETLNRYKRERRILNIDIFKTLGD